LLLQVYKLRKALQTVVFSISLTAFVLSGCTRSVNVETVFPEPVLEPYPLTAGVRFPADMADFEHTEDTALQPEWTIRLGEANLQMFRILFAAMFNEVVELPANREEEIPQNVDFVIEPKLEELEFSAPSQSGTDQYVVWLRYNLKLLETNGQLINDWRVTAYGQEDKGSMGLGSEGAMKDATIKALRDAAANIVMNFPTAPGVAEGILPGADTLDADTDLDVTEVATITDADIEASADTIIRDEDPDASAVTIKSDEDIEASADTINTDADIDESKLE